MSSATLYKSFVNAEKENRAALLTYTVGGDPNKSISLEIFREIAVVCAGGFLGIRYCRVPYNIPERLGMIR